MHSWFSLPSNPKEMKDTRSQVLQFLILVSSVQSFCPSPIHPDNAINQWSLYSIDPTTKAYPQQPPHAGCHFRPIHPGTPSNHRGPRKSKRFFEGWYYRVTLPDDDASFAFIYSIEDPFERATTKKSKLSMVCHQIMGPDDEYLVQADDDTTKFWAWTEQQGLGCVFQYHPKEIDSDSNTLSTTTTALDPTEFSQRVETGFQMLPTRLQGKLNGHDGSLGGILQGQGIPGECSYDITINPISGWGDDDLGQKSTAGWLASYAVFEPHWQVTMADGRATGSVTWKNRTYTFQNAPFYAEKNWGGAFPIKWYWCQCNSFDGWMTTSDGRSLSVTAGGGTRKIPLGQTESLGMVSVHCDGKFYEATPWLGTMEWDVSTWGYWKMTGRSTRGERPFEVELEAICDSPGVKLRAPTEKDGMVYFCRDSFLAAVELSLWELDWDPNTQSYIRGKVVVDKARSKQAAVEIGGGPWWDDWKSISVMKQPMRGMVRFPYRISNLRKRIGSKLKGVKQQMLKKNKE